MRKVPIILGVLVAVALLAIGCEGRIDKGIVGRANAATNTSTFAPVADAYVNASTPDTNYGAATQLSADGDPVKISYLRFDVSGLPSGGTVTSAKLRLYVNNETPDGPGVRNINTRWEENTVTWNTRPSIDETSIVGDLGAITLGSWVEIDVTPMITGNGTFNLALTQPNTDGSGFHSREGANKPQLVVTTEDNVAPPPPPTTTKEEAESTTLAGSLVRVHANTAASGGQEVAYYTTGSASDALNGPADSITLRAREDACNGDPILDVFVDGTKRGSATINGGAGFADYKV
ncbi:MAG: DNRLRE domain-containing protein, partial [Actinomycetota bacterium]|nr:DNRLRE domain-containing protein [Actinomycetota bacterium]